MHEWRSLKWRGFCHWNNQKEQKKEWPLERQPSLYVRDIVYGNYGINGTKPCYCIITMISSLHEDDDPAKKETYWFGWNDQNRWRKRGRKNNNGMKGIRSHRRFFSWTVWSFQICSVLYKLHLCSKSRRSGVWNPRCSLGFHLFICGGGEPSFSLSFLFTNFFFLLSFPFFSFFFSWLSLYIIKASPFTLFWLDNPILSLSWRKKKQWTRARWWWMRRKK